MQKIKIATKELTLVLLPIIEGELSSADSFTNPS